MFLGRQTFPKDMSSSREGERTGTELSVPLASQNLVPNHQQASPFFAGPQDRALKLLHTISLHCNGGPDSYLVAMTILKQSLIF